MPDIPVDQLTTKQALRYLVEWSKTVTDSLDHLEDAVDKQIADATAQSELIAILKEQLAAAQEAKEAAVAGEAEAQEKLTQALDRAEAAADKLDADDAPEPDQEPADPNA